MRNNKSVPQRGSETTTKKDVMRLENEKGATQE
jgi:hypothetical protein